MRVVKDSDVRKQEILLGALNVFAKKGYDKTTITDIAKELGISQGLCYRYYASKEEIYDAALETYADYIVTSNIGRFSAGGCSFREKVQKYAGSLEEYKTPERNDNLLYKLFHGAGSQKMHDELMLRIAQKLVRPMTGVIRAASDKGEIQVEDAETTAYFLVYGQMGMLMSMHDQTFCNERIQKWMMEYFKF